jgi:hypothetical protein
LSPPDLEFLHFENSLNHKASSHSLLRVLALTFVALVVALLASAVSILRLRFEGFACTGVGIVWVACAGGYGILSIAGWRLRSAAGLPVALHMRAKGEQVALLVAGFILTGVWLTKNQAGGTHHPEHERPRLPRRPAGAA